MRSQPWQWVQKRWPYLLGGLAVLLLVASVLVLPGILVTKDLGAQRFQELKPMERAKALNDVRMTLLQGLGGGVLLVGAFLTARQIRISREGQVTDRYTKAIDQLGQEKSVDVHIGGIYALEHIARDSERDRETIVQVLLAYVREHLPRTPEMLASHLVS